MTSHIQRRPRQWVGFWTYGADLKAIEKAVIEVCSRFPEVLEVYSGDIDGYFYLRVTDIPKLLVETVCKISGVGGCLELSAGVVKPAFQSNQVIDGPLQVNTLVEISAGALRGYHGKVKKLADDFVVVEVPVAGKLFELTFPQPQVKVVVND